ncbi:hypothetical protein [Amycolatopsis sp. NPDC051102]|uniref:aromatic-ring hydroxylase C-terminal domain-containing protein n=1 Tax=Amycolatopsis sp. NPDC051102 TaxID=3155163 RepID=UPI00343A1BBE
MLRSSGLNLRLAMARNPAEVALRFMRTQMVKRVPAVSRAAIGEITGIGYGYPAPRGAHPSAGRRTPDHALASGRLYETLRAGKFVLVLPKGSHANVPPSQVVTAHWPDSRRDALLVRPDGYTAWAVDSPDVSEIESAALGWTGTYSQKRG